MEIRRSEEFNKNTKEIHELSSREIVKLINDEDKKVALAVSEAVDSIAKMADKAAEVINNGGRIIYLGSGASGDLAANDAQEIPGTYGVPFDTFRSIHLQLGPNRDWQKLSEGGFTFPKRDGGEDGADQVIIDLKEINFNSKDFVIGISVSGTTAVIVKALEWVKQQGGTTGCVVMNHNSPMGKASDYEVVAVSGAEVISGSTRMKGGTTTKMILNTLSTTTMVKLGNVYKGLMVGVTIPPEGNSKIEERAIRIVAELTGLEFDAAKELFQKHDTNIKCAVVAHNKGLSKEEAYALLEKEKGMLQNIL